MAKAYGRDIASAACDGYSDALRAKSGRWGPEPLAALPVRYAIIRAWMPNQNLEGPVLEGVIDVFERLSEIEHLRYN